MHNRYYSYINTAISVIAQYDGKVPLAVYMKQFFAAAKKYGSKDRKQISALCYHYYRVAKILPDQPNESQLQMASFLCEHQPSVLLENLQPTWNEHIGDYVNEKKDILNIRFDNKDLFPFRDALSKGVDEEAFALSFLQQPKLFLRLRKGYDKLVIPKLKAIAVAVEQIDAQCIAMPNGTKVDEELQIDKEAVIQDYNSQQVGKVIQAQIPASGTSISLWDCCAASGGKSIMLNDLFTDIQLTVSDVRPSILHNLKNRFQRAGIVQFQSFVADLTSDEPIQIPSRQKFDWVLADVPCTGSGTWSRTPEQMFFFEKASIEEYAVRQKQIVNHVVRHIKKNGYLIYITCSVFKQENEEIVAHIKQKHKLHLIHQQLLVGYDKFADTMFVAILQKKEG